MKIAICENEQCQGELIKQYILEHKEYVPSIEVSVFSSGEAFLDAYAKEGEVDILFLDIQMDGINGIELAHEVRKNSKNTIIFFITGFTEYVSDAFIVDAFQFLQKPVRQELFDREFSRALAKHYTQNRPYLIENKTEIIRLTLQEIMYLEILAREITLHTTQGKYRKKGRLEQEEKILLPYGFVRIHRTYLVNMSYISMLEKGKVGKVILKNQLALRLGEGRQAEVMRRYNQFQAGGNVS